MERNSRKAFGAASQRLRLFYLSEHGGTKGQWEGIFRLVNKGVSPENPAKQAM